jgi:hypothetical protein
LAKEEKEERQTTDNTIDKRRERRKELWFLITPLVYFLTSHFQNTNVYIQTN